MKTIQLLLIAALLMPLASCSKKTAGAAAADGEGERDYKEMARNFVRNPDGLRNLVEENEDNQRRIRDMEGRLSTSRQTETSATNDLRQAQSQIADLQAQLASAESRATTAESALSEQQQQNELDTDQQIVDGIIFQVQLGAFAQADNQVESDLATGDGLELQDQNGLQKVVVSQFRSYASARQLRDRLRQMGVRDAFVVAKQDGVRIPVPEALELTGQN
ncbi:MAG: hypothetical protein AAFP08_14515 [Bacteroidota bacterium]